MSAPVARTSSTCTALMVAWVPTGMKAGVRMRPWAVTTSPRRAWPSVAIKEKENGSDIGTQDCRKEAGLYTVSQTLSPNPPEPWNVGTRHPSRHRVSLAVRPHGAHERHVVCRQVRRGVLGPAAADRLHADICARGAARHGGRAAEPDLPARAA